MPTRGESWIRLILGLLAILVSAALIASTAVAWMVIAVSWLGRS